MENTPYDQPNIMLGTERVDDELRIHSKQAAQ